MFLLQRRRGRQRIAAQPRDRQLRAEAVHRQGAPRLIGLVRKRREPARRTAAWRWACSVHVSGTPQLRRLRRQFGDRAGHRRRPGHRHRRRGRDRHRRPHHGARARSRPTNSGCPSRTSTISRPDTDLTTHALGALASRVTYVAGNAVKRAAAQACATVAGCRRRQLEAAPANWSCRSRTSIVPAAARTERRHTAGCRSGGRAPSSTGRRCSHRRRSATWTTPRSFPDQIRYGNESGAYNFVAEAAEVEVDPATGAVTRAGDGRGRRLRHGAHPAARQGQVEGAIAQGLGMRDDRGLRLGTAGAPTGPNFIDYRLPTAGFMPKLHVEFADSYEPTGPFGAKGLGEIAPGPGPRDHGERGCRCGRRTHPRTADHRPRRSSGACGTVPGRPTSDRA